MKTYSDKIIQPLVSEKSARREGKFNEFSVVVDPSLTKTDIKKAVKELFGVDVVTVRTLNFRKKTKQTKYGIIPAKLYKKALLRLREGQRIELK